MTEVGLYGKLPSHGDFLRRRLADDFVARWDAWLQHALTASRAALGGRWLDAYLTSPIWRFAAAPGAVSSAAMIGVMAPSVDRVGRYFPLTIAAPLPDGADVLAAAVAAEGFFARAAQLVVDTLDSEVVEFERVDEDVVRLGAELACLRQAPAVALEAGAAAVIADGPVAAWHMPLASPGELAPTLLQLLSQRLAQRYAPLTLWWTEGSADVEAGCLVVKGLPSAEGFAAMLEGSWAPQGWHEVPARVERESELPFTALERQSAIGVRSAAKTDVGRTRRINQDAFVERPEVGLWAVADGMGGHANGEVASRMVCDALADLAPAPTVEAMAEGVRERLDAVNAHLLRSGEESLLADVCGSTVVVLVVRGSQMTALWVGDSRVYRWRAGGLQQLTRDHSAPPGPGGRPETNGVTRAVGAAPGLRLDAVHGDVQPGDRFLLCSDGLTRTVPDAVIGESLDRADPLTAVEALIAASLAAGAPDNVTALVVEAVSGAAGAPPATRA